MENGVDRTMKLMVRMTVIVRGDGKVEEVNERCGRWWWEMVVACGELRDELRWRREAEMVALAEM